MENSSPLLLCADLGDDEGVLVRDFVRERAFSASPFREKILEVSRTPHPISNRPGQISQNRVGKSLSLQIPQTWGFSTLAML